ncbi:NUDIX hydrolase [Halorhodospira halophila]|uniref:NUDIX hydrolase n=1 Tax=Halorhodospira halophila (strain DSM 244 / SL1) TaxID=349124 RepID=A1WT97_HALHL|nr:CoA pyrophosphatase [Halorhodospira halophila]ABM60909.1 NUDIX hydrolase [Halorhodospira halophila SL1]
MPRAAAGTACCPEALRARLMGRAWPERGWRRSPGSPVPAAVLIALLEPQGASRILLTRRAGGLRDHPGQVSFPGGRVDPGDPTPEATALREAHEEVGLDPGVVHILGRLGRYHTGTGFVIQPVVAAVREPVAWSPCEGEVEAVFELPLERLREGRVDGEVRVPDPLGRVQRFPAMIHQEQLIWGATAGMLWQLREALQGIG